jgi:hypothetical protein
MIKVFDAGNQISSRGELGGEPVGNVIGAYPVSGEIELLKA